MLDAEARVSHGRLERRAVEEAELRQQAEGAAEWRHRPQEARGVVARFHASGNSPLPIDESRLEELRGAIDALGTRQLTATLGHLAKGLPIYDVVFDSAGHFEVHGT